MKIIFAFQHAGTYLSWSADSLTVRWSLGPDLFSAGIAEVFAKRKDDDKDDRKDDDEDDDEDDERKGARRRPAAGSDVEATSVRLGWSHRADMPSTDLFLVGATIAPMDDLSVIEDGVVHVRRNRIVAVGTREEVPVPEGADTLDCAEGDRLSRPQAVSATTIKTAGMCLRRLIEGLSNLAWRQG